MKTIGFIGTDCTDIVIYLARLISVTDKKIGIIDCSINKNLSYTVALPDEISKNNSYYKNILIMSGENNNKNDIMAQDYVFYYFESNVLDSRIEECSELVLVSDMLISHAQLFRKLTVKEIPKVMIIHNAISVKYGPKFLISITGQSVEKNNIFIISYDERDIKSKCYLCTDKTHKLTNLSVDMKNVLQELFVRYTEAEYSGKEIARFFKSA